MCVDAMILTKNNSMDNRLQGELIFQLYSMQYKVISLKIEKFLHVVKIDC